MFTNSIPQSVLENPNTRSFIDILDGVYDYKQDNLAQATRFNNIAVLTNKEWLCKKLLDYGFSVPSDLPLIVIQQMLLNIEQLLRLKGSKMGIELYCSILTLGSVDVEVSQLCRVPPIVIPDSSLNGFITDDDTNPDLFLVDNSDQLDTPGIVDITIATKYKDTEEFTAIKEYLDATLKDWIPTFGTFQVNISYNSNEEYFYHSLLNKYFI